MIARAPLVFGGIMKITNAGTVYRVWVRKWLGGPLCIVLGLDVFIVDSGDRNTNKSYARAVIAALRKD